MRKQLLILFLTLVCPFYVYAQRLIPFEVSNETAYILEFGEKYVAFYQDGSPVAPLAITTNYANEYLFDIKFIQA